MTAGAYRPLLVVGVAGGVGTSTWVRVMRQATTVPVQDGGVYRVDGPVLPVDIVVTSNTAAAAARVGPVLAVCPRRPLLVVMHTAGGQLTEARAFLRMAEPHVTARFDIDHRRAWLDMPAAPGVRLPTKAQDIERAVAGLVPALQAMYASPPRPPAQHRGGPHRLPGAGGPLRGRPAPGMGGPMPHRR